MRRTREAPVAVGGPSRSRGKNVLYCGLDRTRAAAFFATLGEVPGFTRSRESGGTCFTYGDVRLRFVLRHDPCEALETLHRQYFNLVVLDLRAPDAPRARVRQEVEKALCLLDRIDQEPDVELRYGFHRILVLVSGPDATDVDDLIRTLGARGVGRVLRDTAHCVHDRSCGRLPHPVAFGKVVLDEVLRTTLERHPGKSALCASGGGITGIYFEMGALKCLDDCLPPGALESLDMYFGISAGAVVTSILANGYTMDEFLAGIAGHEAGRIHPTSLSLLRLSHLDPQVLLSPARNIVRGVASAVTAAVKGRVPVSLESILLEYTDLLSAPFKAAGFEEILRNLFDRPGRSNDFRGLPRKLYVGATDQDAREHVLFGDEGFDDVPVSRAVQASISINPAFSSTKIGDRYYVDGAVTRTSNFVEAIRKGCDLVFAIDPLVPYVSKGRAGFAQNRGILYNADQDIRTVSYTRFETTRNWVLRRHPEVSLYTFLPANRLRKLMSVNPMDHRPFLPIWRGAYLSTFQRIQLLQHRLSGDLASHGMALRLDRAREVARRLEASPRAKFSDFFPDGRVEIRTSRVREETDAAAFEPLPGPALSPRETDTAA